MRIAHATQPCRILAVASGGGHFIQLLRLQAAWKGADVAYLTTEPGYKARVDGARFYVVPDANRWRKWRLLRCLVAVARVLLRERPDVVVSTGAAPGYLAIRIGKMLGARTIWVESIANVDEMSMSGRLVGPHADLWLTQWEHLARPQGPFFAGSVL